MSGGQGTSSVKLNLYFLDLAIHQVTRYASDAYSGSAVRTGRTPHDWADDIIENAWIFSLLDHAMVPFSKVWRDF
jgi:hypothetical protein